MNDGSSKIVHLAAAILDAARSAIDKSEPYLEETNEKPDIAYELLIMLNSADDLMELFDPSKEAGEYFGLPRHVNMLEEEPEMEFRNAADWDFKPWYCEKTLSIKRGVKTAIEYWRMDLDDVELVNNAPMTPREWLRSGVLTGLKRAARDAQKIFDLTFNDEIEVSERKSERGFNKSL